MPPIAAIGEIVGERAVSPSNAVRSKAGQVLRCALLRPSVLHAACVLGAVLLLSSQAAADRISLLNFDGSNGRALRWRVAGALKRSGHTVVGVAPPKNPSPAKLRAFAKRRKVDLFIAGSSARVDDGWELALTMRDPEGEEVGKGLTISAGSFREILKELKADGQSQIDDAVRGGGRAAAVGGEKDDDAVPSADFAEDSRPEARKKKGSRTEPAAIDLDGDATASDESRGSAESGDNDSEEATTEDSGAGAADTSARALRRPPVGRRPRALRTKTTAESPSSATNRSPTAARSASTMTPRARRAPRRRSIRRWCWG
jgi:hypothetical protein